MHTLQTEDKRHTRLPQSLNLMEIQINFTLFIKKGQPLRMRSVPPCYYSGAAWNVPRWPCTDLGPPGGGLPPGGGRWPPWGGRIRSVLSLPRAQHWTLPLIIVVGGLQSVLPDVLAMHTIEMIPKSMILVGHLPATTSYKPSSNFYSGVRIWLK